MRAGAGAGAAVRAVRTPLSAAENRPCKWAICCRCCCSCAHAICGNRTCFHLLLKCLIISLEIHHQTRQGKRAVETIRSASRVDPYCSAGWQSWHTLNLSLIPRVRLTTLATLAANCQPDLVPCSCLIINMWDLRTSHLAIPCTTSPPTSLFLSLLCFWLFNLFLSRVKSFLKCFQFLVSVASSLFWFNAGFKFAYVMDTSGICTLYFRSDYRYFSIRLAPLWGVHFP